MRPNRVAYSRRSWRWATSRSKREGGSRVDGVRDLRREMKEVVLESISATGFSVGEASWAAQVRWSWRGSCQG